MLKGERAEWDGRETRAPPRQSQRTHRIVLNVGDDLADFLPDVRRATLARRASRRDARADSRWGRDWFLLPNPMYGSWLVALGPDFDSALAAEPRVKQDCPAPEPFPV